MHSYCIIIICCLVLSRLMYGAAESWALTGSQAAQLELLDGTGQMPISQLLSRHRVRWLGHAAHKPGTTIWSHSC